MHLLMATFRMPLGLTSKKTPGTQTILCLTHSSKNTRQSLSGGGRFDKSARSVTMDIHFLLFDELHHDKRADVSVYFPLGHRVSPTPCGTPATYIYIN
mmetsp:Transcript_21282/g.38457  ORF Transcript_21282/g.38457 Transcript_21282/m.38457 type:complete len:98 (-) Transcript_21282:82-375(-)